MKTTIIFNLLSLALVSAKTVKEQIQVGLPKFNLESGFYKESSVKLKIRSSDPKATIYYTTDGSIPNENSFIYKKPITLKNKSLEENVYSAIKQVDPYEDFVPHEKIKKANIIRAIVKYPNNTLSEVVSKTYWVGLNRKKLYGDLPVVSLISDPDNLFGYENGIYVMGKDYDDWVREDPENANMVYYRKIGNYNRKGKNSEVPATIEYFPGDKKRKIFNDDVGIRIMGAVSRTFIQKSFRVSYREEYGKKNLKYELFPGNMRSDGKGPVEKYKNFIIRDGGNDFENTVFKDKFFQTLVRDRNFETQSTDMAVLFLDGEFWGVYVITENYDAHYIENNYGIDKDNVVIIKRDKVEDGVENDLKLFEKTMDYIYNVNVTSSDVYSDVSKLLDVETFAWYAAFQFYINSADCVFHGNNWAMWRAREPVPDTYRGDGTYRILLYDTESAAGYNEGADSYTSFRLMEEAFDPNHFNSVRIGTRLLNNLLNNRDFKNLFINALSDMRNIDFDLDKVNSLLRSIDKTVRRVMTDHFIRFGYEKYIEEGPANHYNNQYNALKTWLNGRHGVFLEYIASLFNFKPAVNVTVTSDNFRKGGFTVNGGNTVFIKKYKGLYFGENVLYLTAAPTKGRTFKYWKVENCKFANSDYTINTKSKMKQTTVGVYPSKGCKVVAYFK